jgi:hypothetical protein
MTPPGEQPVGTINDPGADLKREPGAEAGTGPAKGKRAVTDIDGKGLIDE